MFGALESPRNFVARVPDQETPPLLRWVGMSLRRLVVVFFTYDQWDGEDAAQLKPAPTIISSQKKISLLSESEIGTILAFKMVLTLVVHVNVWFPPQCRVTTHRGQRRFEHFHEKRFYSAMLGFLGESVLLPKADIKISRPLSIRSWSQKAIFTIGSVVFR